MSVKFIKVCLADDLPLRAFCEDTQNIDKAVRASKSVACRSATIKSCLLVTHQASVDLRSQSSQSYQYFCLQSFTFFANIRLCDVLWLETECDESSMIEFIPWIIPARLPSSNKKKIFIREFSHKYFAPLPSDSFIRVHGLCQRIKFWRRLEREFKLRV